jgi:hypothetical protein
MSVLGRREETWRPAQAWGEASLGESPGRVANEDVGIENVDIEALGIKSVGIQSVDI